MNENRYPAKLCVFCQALPGEHLCTQTVFGSAAVCRKCWAKYRAQLQRAVERLNKLNKRQPVSDKNAENAA